MVNAWVQSGGESGTFRTGHEFLFFMQVLHVTAFSVTAFSPACHARFWSYELFRWQAQERVTKHRSVCLFGTLQKVARSAQNDWVGRRSLSCSGRGFLKASKCAFCETVVFFASFILASCEIAQPRALVAGRQVRISHFLGLPAWSKCR